MSADTHKWFMTHIRPGYFVVEGCPRCRARASFFSTEPIAPVDEYREGEHSWSYMGSYQAVKLDLECGDCGKVVDLGDMNALMLSTCDEPDCQVGELVRRRGEGSWVYVALCANSTHTKGKCVSPEGIEALNQYFSQDTAPGDRTVVVVPCKMCNSIERCMGIIIADVGLTEIY